MTEIHLELGKEKIKCGEELQTAVVEPSVILCNVTDQLGRWALQILFIIVLTGKYGGSSVKLGKPHRQQSEKCTLDSLALSFASSVLPPS